MLFSAVLLAAPEQISRCIGAAEDMQAYTCDYLRILALACPVLLFVNVFANLVRADGSAGQSMIANALGTITNIILDPVLILWIGMGVKGRPSLR